MRTVTSTASVNRLLSAVTEALAIVRAKDGSWNPSELEKLAGIIREEGARAPSRAVANLRSRSAYGAHQSERMPDFSAVADALTSLKRGRPTHVDQVAKMLVDASDALRRSAYKRVR